MKRTFRVVELREDVDARFGCSVLLESFTEKPTEAIRLYVAFNGNKVPEMFRVGGEVAITIEPVEIVRGSS